MGWSLFFDVWERLKAVHYLTLPWELFWNFTFSPVQTSHASHLYNVQCSCSTNLLKFTKKLFFLFCWKIWASAEFNRIPYGTQHNNLGQEGKKGAGSTMQSDNHSSDTKTQLGHRIYWPYLCERCVRAVGHHLLAPVPPISWTSASPPGWNTCPCFNIFLQHFLQHNISPG